MKRMRGARASARSVSSSGKPSLRRSAPLRRALPPSREKKRYIENVGSGTSTVSARLDERFHQQAQRVVHAIGQQHLRRPHAKRSRQPAHRFFVLRIHGQLLGRHSAQRAQNRGRTAHRIFVEIQPQLALAALFRRLVRREMRATEGTKAQSAQGLCAFEHRCVSPIAFTGAPPRPAGAPPALRHRPAPPPRAPSCAIPPASACCTVVQRTKSQVESPPRVRAPPLVGST